MSLHGWVANRRVESAKLLLRGKDPSAQFASACGFSRQSHMARAFSMKNRRYSLCLPAASGIGLATTGSIPQTGGAIIAELDLAIPTRVANR